MSYASCSGPGPGGQFSRSRTSFGARDRPSTGPVACVKQTMMPPSGISQAPAQLVKPGRCGER
jgi:hypothetical protein